MADQNEKGSLSQEEIDKAVGMGHGKPDDIEEEVCEGHQCDSSFTCHKPFYNLDTVKSQTCGGHSCKPDYTCPKPFGCSPAHLAE